jgi:hypothetical protein
LINYCHDLEINNIMIGNVCYCSDTLRVVLNGFSFTNKTNHQISPAKKIRKEKLNVENKTAPER